MSSTLATWDKISGALSSTNTQFGGSWGNLISDYLNGVDIGIIDPTKLPRINTLTRYKYEKFGLLDGDESHHIIFSAADIDTGGTRKIIFRRMNSPNEVDYAVLENLTQVLKAKSMDGVDNTFTNIPKTAIPSSVLYNDVDNNLGAHFFDMTAIASPGNPLTNQSRIFTKAIDGNNDGIFYKIKKNGSFIEGQFI